MDLALIILCLAAAFGVVEADRRGARRLVWLLKPAASVCFVLLALAGGALESMFGTVILAGLVLSLIGDAALIPDSKRTFLIGMAAFALAHAAYTGAFVIGGLEPRYLAMSLAALVMAGVSLALLRSLWGGLEAFKWPVVAYSAIISVMVVVSFAALTPAGKPAWLLPAAAAAFAASDISVARLSFGGAGHATRLWGLPLYYVAQLMFASSV